MDEPDDVMVDTALEQNVPSFCELILEPSYSVTLSYLQSAANSNESSLNIVATTCNTVVYIHKSKVRSLLRLRDEILYTRTE